MRGERFIRSALPSREEKAELFAESAAVEIQAAESGNRELRAVRRREQNEQHTYVKDRPANDEKCTPLRKTLTSDQPQRGRYDVEANGIQQESNGPKHAVMQVGKLAGRNMRND